jgi:hypothetical protein
MSCVSQKQFKREISLLEEKRLESNSLPNEGYTDWQADSFYNLNSDFLFRSRYIAKRFMSLVDTLRIKETSFNSRLSLVEKSLSELSTYMHNEYAKKSKVAYFNNSESALNKDLSITLDFSKDEQTPNILQFFVLFNSQVVWKAVGSFNVDLNHLYDSYYGVVCTEGVDGTGKSSFRAAYTIQYDTAAKKVEIQRALMGRKGVNNWYDSFKDETYGIRSIVAIY